jgi:hypothetical protein
VDGAYGEYAAFAEVVGVAGAELDAADPDHVMVVAEPAAAGFDVWFLEVDGIGAAGVAFFDIAGAEVEEFLFAIGDALAAEVVFEFVEDGAIACDEAVLEKSAHGLVVFEGLLEGFLEGADGVADFEADVPEHVEDIFDDFAGARGHFAPGAFHVEEVEVDVGAWVEEAAAVAAGGDEGDLGAAAFGFAEGSGEEVVEDDVEEAGALAADLGAAEACAVLEADAVFFFFEEAFVEFEDLFWGGGWVESGCEDAAGVGLDFVEVAGHEGRARRY